MKRGFASGNAQTSSLFTPRLPWWPICGDEGALRRLIPTFPPGTPASVTSELPRTWHGLQSTSCSAQSSDPQSTWRGYVGLASSTPCSAHQKGHAERGLAWPGPGEPVGRWGPGLSPFSVSHIPSENSCHRDVSSRPQVPFCIC